MASNCHRACVVALFLWGCRSLLAGVHWVGAGDRVVAWTNDAVADRVRLGVRDEGVYRVTAGDIASASGLSSNAVVAALEAGGVSLSAQGRTVAWTKSGDALLFNGVPTTELYAPENVYWLELGAGEQMGVYDAAPDPAAATNVWFMHAESYRSVFLAPSEPYDRRSSQATLTNVLNFGEWLGKRTIYDVRARTCGLTLPGFCAGAQTGLVAQASLASYYDFVYPDNHTCEILVNGTSCGQQSWSGEQAVVLDYAVPQGVATNSGITFTITNRYSTVEANFMLLDLTLLYPRTYAAASGRVLCTGGAAGTVSATGFSSPNIHVWDVTDPEAPLALAGEVTPDTNGLWRAAFLCGDARSRYAVFEEAAGCYEPSVSGVRDTDWNDSDEMPELAIVVPPQRWAAGFDAAVQPLADLRNAQGLRTRVIHAEEIYNAFSDGVVHPEAFRRFSAAGVTNGAAQRLRYLLFAGHGGSDYKLEVFGVGEKGRYPSLFPLYLHAQVENDTATGIQAALMLPNDPVLGDVDGSALPEVAVGRFIATNLVELSAMVNKTIRYELTATWKNKGVFVACKQLPTDVISFSNFVAQTASAFVSGGWMAECLYPMAPPNDALNVLWDYNGTGASAELREGSGFFYYFGHSNDEFLGTGGSAVNTFVTPATIRAGTWRFAPVALMIGCRIGRWTFLDLKTYKQCVAEAGVRNPSSGFVAAVSPSGYMESSEATRFSNGFRDAIAAGALRLGDAYLAGFAALSPEQAANMRHMTLLGDPSLTIRAGQTARGTSSQWLIDRGLTNNPYADLQDQDGDGFATWKEYQAGTECLEQAVRIRGIGVRDQVADGNTLTFEPIGDTLYRVMSSTNLAAGPWERVPWKASATNSWSEAGIPVDWPVESVIVPFEGAGPLRFYKVQSDD